MADVKIVISGGFDPINKEHIRLIREAAEYGKVIVCLNTDAWLSRKKGYSYQEWSERAEILESIKGVWTVVPADDSDGTVIESLRALRPDYFATNETKTPELKACKRLGVVPLSGIGQELSFP
jgi:glycerol-3-phosphate cytidylyltransferase-like family protein